MDEVDGISGGAADIPPRRSRRWFVAGGLALVAGGGAGVAVGLARDSSHPAGPRAVPAALRAARADEIELIAAAGAPEDGSIDTTVTAALLRDHRAHLAALDAAIREIHGIPLGREKVKLAIVEDQTRASLRVREQRAAQRAAGRAAQLSGPVAALLASIAACEATHAELLR